MARSTILLWISLYALFICICDTNATVLNYYPIVSMTAASATEGSRIQVPVSLRYQGYPPSLPCYVTYSTQDGSAKAGEDYYPAVGTVMFATGETHKLINISTIKDTSLELNETFFLVLTSSIGCRVYTELVELTVLDATPIVLEGLQIDVPVSLPEPATAPCYLTYSTLDGTASAGTDYNPAVGTLEWAAGETTQIVSIFTLGDIDSEGLETFSLLLNSSFGCPIPSQTIHLIIVDNTNVPTLSVTGSQVVESENAAVQFTVTLSHAHIVPVYCTLDTVSGTAYEGDDYLRTTVLWGIPAGETNFSVPVGIIDNDAFELTEEFYLNITQVTNAIALPNTRGVGTITDNDRMPSLSFSNVTLLAGPSTEGDLVGVVVLLSGLTEVDPGIGYSFTALTAFPNTDFDPNAQIEEVQLAADLVQYHIYVRLLDDNINEDTETFSLGLSAIYAQVDPDHPALNITILDNDPLPNCTISTSTPSVLEGWVANFTVSLSAPSSKNISVQFSQTPGTALAVADYVPVTTSLTIPAGSTSVWIGVPTVQDTIMEPSQTFTAYITSPNNCIVTTNNASVTILDDDQANKPFLSVSPASVSVNEGLGVYSVTVTLTGATEMDVNVSYAFTPGSASLGSDFSGAPGVLSFRAPSTGVLTLSVPVTIVQDTLDEDTETFVFSLINATNAVISSSATQSISILDDDPLPSCFIQTSPTLVPEGIGMVNIALLLSAPSGKSVSVQFTQIPGTASFSDFLPVITTLTIPAGSTSTMIGIPIIQDSLVEPSETFQVVINSPINCTISVGSITVTILDDDGVGPSRSPGFKSLEAGTSGDSEEVPEPGGRMTRWIAGVAVGAACIGILVGALFFAMKKNETQ